MIILKNKINMLEFAYNNRSNHSQQSFETSSADGSNNFLTSLLVPQGVPSPIPDLNGQPSVIKVIRGEDTLTGVTNSVIYFAPYSSAATAIHGVRVATHPVSGLPCVGWSGILALDDSPMGSYDENRVISYGLELYTDTLPSGAYSITGRVNGAHFSSVPSWSSLDPAAITQYNTFLSVSGVSIMDGIMALALPRVVPRFKATNYNASAPTYLSTFTNERTYIMTGISQATTGASTAFNFYNLDVRNPSFPDTIRGSFKVNVEVSMPSVTIGAGGTQGLDIRAQYVNAAGALTTIQSRFIRGYFASAATSANFIGEVSFNSPYPIARIVFEGNNITTVTTFNAEIEISCINQQPDEDMYNTLIYAYGLDASSNLSINQYANFEAVPNQNLSKDIIPAAHPPEKIEDLDMALIAISKHALIRPLMSRTDYGQLLQMVSHIVNRSSLRHSYALSWEDVKGFGRRVFNALRDTKSSWQPAISALNPYLGGVAGAVFSQSSNQAPAVTYPKPPVSYAASADKLPSGYSFCMSKRVTLDLLKSLLESGKTLQDAVDFISTTDTGAVVPVMEVRTRALAAEVGVPIKSCLAFSSGGVAQATTWQWFPTVGEDGLQEPCLAILSTKALSHAGQLLAYTSVGDNLRWACTTPVDNTVSVQVVAANARFSKLLTTAYLTIYNPNQTILAGGSCGLAIAALLSGLPSGFMLSGEIDGNGNFIEVAGFALKSAMPGLICTGFTDAQGRLLSPADALFTHPARFPIMVRSMSELFSCIMLFSRMAPKANLEAQSRGDTEFKASTLDREDWDNYKDEYSEVSPGNANVLVSVAAEGYVASNTRENNAIKGFHDWVQARRNRPNRKKSKGKKKAAQPVAFGIDFE